MYILAMSFASALLLLLSSFDLYAASFLTIIYNLFLSVLFCFCSTCGRSSTVLPEC